MEAGTPVSPRCQGPRSRLGGAVHGSEVDTLDGIGAAQAYDGKTKGRVIHCRLENGSVKDSSGAGIAGGWDPHGCRCPLARISSAFAPHYSPVAACAARASGNTARLSRDLDPRAH